MTPRNPAYRPHHVLGFTAVPGQNLREQVSTKRARRMSEPSSSSPPCKWLDVTANNAGFFSPYEYPYRDTGGNSSPFQIGIFGGSVSHWFALQVGAELAAQLDPHLQGSGPSLVLNYAIGGMKQPQTLFALNWSLTEGQRFDAVVVLDGFNEAALSYLNYTDGYRPSAPSIQHLATLTDSLTHYEQPQESNTKKSDVTQIIAEHWARSSKIMHDLCRSQGIPVVHLVQPNQYYSNKPFSLRERRRALGGNSPYRAGVELIYPLIEQAATRLTTAGYSVTNAIDAFDDIRETVYADNCCHYNLRGNLILKDMVLELLTDAVSPNSPPIAPRTPADLSAPPDRTRETIDDDSEDDAVYPMW